MSPRTPSGPSLSAFHGWRQAGATTLAGLVAMWAVAALGAWAAGAARIPGGAFPRVVTAAVLTAVGGSVKLSGSAGELARTRATLTVMPLSVTVTGTLVFAAGFLRPLRHRAAVGGRELAGWAGRVGALWLLTLIGLAFIARQTFAVAPGGDLIGDIGGLFDASPKVGFSTDVPLTVVFGTLWLAGVMVLALLIAGGAPLPARLVRLRQSVRPAAYTMAALLLGFVAVGVVVALVMAATRGHDAHRDAVVLLGLPNLVWPAFTIGLGATWRGRLDGPSGLPMPHLLDEVLRGPDVSPLNLGTLADHDGRVWWLVVVDAVLLLAAGFLMAARSPVRVPEWRHGLRMALSLALTVLMICLVGRVSVHYGLYLVGLGDVGGSLSGQLLLRPDVWPAVGIAALWGWVAGVVGARLARTMRRRGNTAGRRGCGDR
ncbi:streptophobe family protein [Streptomyces sp. NPDC001843]|uniref:streptophobe family protein n=1 Tax=Streptomyces sp. NPDC001843 TaxID=3364617 RepID=UPI0036AE03C1